MVFIYVLECQQGKYYVGKTNTPNFRLDTHFISGGSAWTKKYKPVGIIELKPDCDDFDEDKYTIKYMKDKGIDNVRGGSFCSIVLSDENIVTLKKMIDGSSNKCYKCGDAGHYANRCNKKKDDVIEKKDVIDKKDIVESFGCKFCDKSFSTQKGATYHENMFCKNKKQKDDGVFKCKFCDKTLQGASYHENIHCKNRIRKSPSGNNIVIDDVVVVNDIKNDIVDEVKNDVEPIKNVNDGCVIC